MIKLSMLLILTIFLRPSLGEVYISLVEVTLSHKYLDEIDHVTNDNLEEMSDKIMTLVEERKAIVKNRVEVCLQGTNTVTVYKESSDLFYVNRVNGVYELMQWSEPVGTGYDLHLKKVGLVDVVYIYEFEQYLKNRDVFSPMPELPVGKPHTEKRSESPYSMSIREFFDKEYLMVGSYGDSDSKLTVLLIQIRKWEMGSDMGNGFSPWILKSNYK